MSNMVQKVHKQAHHRNGIVGTPFDVVIFTDTDGDKMLAILFPDNNPDDCHCAVLSMELLAQDVIEFGKNSWRGDHFIDELRAEIKRQREAQ